MTIEEILRENGLTDDAIKVILEAMKTNKIYTASEENLDIRYGKLKTQHEGTEKQLTEANSLIEELKKSNKGNEGLQAKITAYENQVKQLTEELEKTKINAAIKVELLSGKAVDVDYLTYKLTEKLKADGETLTLDDNGNVKGWADKLAGLKTQFPNMFETSTGGASGYQVLEPNKLKNPEGGEITPTKEAFRAMNYEQRLELKQKNEKLYYQLAK